MGWHWEKVKLSKLTLRLAQLNAPYLYDVDDYDNQVLIYNTILCITRWGWNSVLLIYRTKELEQ